MVSVRFPLRHLVAIAATGLTALLLALLAIELTRLRGGVALLWGANAPLLAVMMLVPPRRWAGHIFAYAAGACIAMLIASPLAHSAALLTLINVGEITLAAVLLRRWHATETLLRTPSSIALLVLAAGIVAPTIGGAPAAAITAWSLGVPFAVTWLDWILAHGLGNLIFTPLAMLVVQRDIGSTRFRRDWGMLPAVAIVALIATTTYLVFAQSRLPLLFVPVLPLLIATFAYQRIGAAVGMVIIAMVGGLLTIDGTGPVMLIKAGEATRLQFFDFYLAVLFLVALPVAAILAQRDELLARLGESETRYRLLADNATDIMFTLELDGTIRFASPSIRELGLFEPEAMIGRNAGDLIHPDDVDRARLAHRAAILAPDSTQKLEHRAVKANGEIGWFETNTRAVRGPDGRVTALVSVIRDLDDRKRREDELLRAATTDPLTGLLNRGAVRRRITDALALAARGTPSTLAVLDLDHFKRVNDVHGHAAGDAALLMLADLLRDNLREQDAIGRIGGEEFAVLFHGLALGAALPICERLRRSLAAARLDFGGASLHVTMSAGLAELAPTASLDANFRAADDALYAAKHAGRNRIKVAAG
jgi:diguanylate cyclase (GGDEF)-like protein/PAS domain S-box-containing protein